MPTRCAGPISPLPAALLILGIAVAFSHLPHIDQTQAFRPGKEGDPVLSRSIWSYRHTVLGALGIFFYVGVEVGLASIAVNYFKTPGHELAQDRIVPGLRSTGLARWWAVCSAPGF